MCVADYTDIEGNVDEAMIKRDYEAVKAGHIGMFEKNDGTKIFGAAARFENCENIPVIDCKETIVEKMERKLHEQAQKDTEEYLKMNPFMKNYKGRPLSNYDWEGKLWAVPEIWAPVDISKIDHERIILLTQREGIRATLKPELKEPGVCEEGKQPEKNYIITHKGGGLSDYDLSTFDTGKGEWVKFYKSGFSDVDIIALVERGIVRATLKTQLKEPTVSENNLEPLLCKLNCACGEEMKSDMVPQSITFGFLYVCANCGDKIIRSEVFPRIEYSAGLGKRYDQHGQRITT